MPEPKLCLSKRGSTEAYGSCNEIFDDDCAHEGLLIDFLVFEENNNVTYCISIASLFSASNFKIIIQAIVKKDIEKTTSGNTTITKNGDFK